MDECSDVTVPQASDCDEEIGSVKRDGFSR
jgi:hypothetical protein